MDTDLRILHFNLSSDTTSRLLLPGHHCAPGLLLGFVAYTMGTALYTDLSEHTGMSP